MNAVELVLGFDLSLPPGSARADLQASWHRVLAPLLRELQERVGVVISLHLGGAVMDHLEAEHPEGVELLRGLVAQERVELLGGAYYDAVLSALPERDALGQLRLASRRAEQLFGARPRGAHLAYSAWDPGMPRLLARAGLGFTTLDAGCLHRAGVPADALHGYFMVEREGACVAVIPDHGAQDAVGPHLETSRVLGLLRRHAARGVSLVTWMLDARELGLKPGSADLCWGRSGAWLPRTLALLVAQDHWVKLTSFAGVLERFRPQGRRYLPSCIAPAVQARLREPEDGGLRSNGAVRLAGVEAPRVAPPLPWEAFLARYSEGNRLHKRMLAGSREVARLAAVARTSQYHSTGAELSRGLERALMMLYQAQAAAVLTHDPWGGIHRGRLRHRCVAMVMRAEHHVARLMGETRRLRVEREDIDCDGREEITVVTPHLQLQIDPALGGAVVRLESIEAGADLCNTLTRRCEAASNALCGGDDLPALVSPSSAGTAGAAAVFLGGATLQVEEDDEDGDTEETPVAADPRPARLPPLFGLDRVERATLQEHFLGPQATLESFARGQHPEIGDFLGAEYQVLMAEPRPEEGLAVVSLGRDGAVTEGGISRLVRLVKRLDIERDAPHIGVHYEISNRSPDPFDAWFGVELNLNLDSDLSGGAYLEVEGERLDLSRAQEIKAVRHLSWGDSRRSVRLGVRVSQPARLWHHPIVAPCEGATGPVIEYQGACILLAWSLPLWGRERHLIDLSLRLGSNGT
ncbi:MAG: alpha-amylase/4-alpha-glucanotransferase domain-containing protein [Pseudomonadota bacterium]